MTSKPKDAGDSAALLKRLEALHPRKIDLSLGRIERLLQALGNPERFLPPLLHVAGTNGKGSLLAFAKAMLEAAGKRVHVYTSPHLVRFHERVELAAKGGARQIADADLVDVLERAAAANRGEPITFFEITTAAAFLAFAERQADFLLLETGLGGRLDATNVIAKPELTAITPVAVDHVDFLGSDLAGIAREKAGILKQGVPCVVARQMPEAWDAIEQRAQALGVPLLAAGRDWDAYEQHGRLVYQTNSDLLDLPLPKLNGRHQIDNAGAAITATRMLLGDEINEAGLAQGLTNVVWPARLERLGPGALYEQVSRGDEIWLDGGHNPSAASVLAQGVAEIEERVPRPLRMIVGMLTSKDAAAFFPPFVGLAQRVVCVPVPEHDKCYEPEALAALARAAGLDAEPARDLNQALALTRGYSREPVRILICGSLYLAGHVLSLHGAAMAA